MRKQKTKGIIYLSVLTIAVSLFSFSMFTSSPNVLVHEIPAMLANATVGLSAAVEPNEYNTLAQTLTAKETELNIREAQMVERGNETNERGVGGSSDTMAVYSFGLSIVLFVLLGVNYFLDWRRGKNQKLSPQIVVS